MTSNPTGVILLNMGGPDRLEDVQPFLFNLFSDRDIIRLGPSFLQKPLAHLISRRRAPKSRNIYNKIGGRSPLKKITLEQAKALECILGGNTRFPVVVAMRYWQPSAKEALDVLAEMGISHLIGLPLYPHYSKATTGSSFADLERAIVASPHHFMLDKIEAWPDHPLYIQCLSDNIKQGLAKFGDETVELVFSAHSLPVSFIREGDPYIEHLEKTIDLVQQSIGRKGLLCFQSRSGPVEWLSPSTSESIENLAISGCKNILMVPISFVSDHVETLYEIDMLFREQANGLGMGFESSASFNTNPLFIQCLKELVLATHASHSRT